MFKQDTLFILGAGASVPYGYPTGKGLIQDIIRNMQDEIFLPTCIHRASEYCFNSNDDSYCFSDFEKNLTDLVGEGYIEPVPFLPILRAAPSVRRI